MKLQTKLLLVVLFLVLTSIFAMGALSIRIAERSIRDFAYPHPEASGRSYSYDRPSRPNDLLRIDGLAGVDSYLAGFGKMAAATAQNMPVRELGNIFALEGDGSVFRGGIETSAGNIVYSPQPVVPWDRAASLALPEDRAFDALTEIGRTALVMAGVFGLTAVFVLFRMLKSYYVQPIMKLKQVAETIARGGALESMEIHSRDKLGELAAGMDAMARAIERRRAEQSARISRLEEEVEARSRELARTNEALRREIEERKQAADAFEVSEGKFHSLFNHMSSGFAYGQIILDGAGRPVDFLFLEVNEQFEKSIGLSSRDVVGRRFTEAFPAAEEEKRRWIELYGQVALTGQSTRFEEYSVHLDRWFSISAYSAKWGFFAAVFEDITRRRKNEEHLRLLLAATDRTDDSVSIADLDGEIGASIPPSSA